MQTRPQYPYQRYPTPKGASYGSTSLGFVPELLSVLPRRDGVVPEGADPMAFNRESGHLGLADPSPFREALLAERRPHAKTRRGRRPADRRQHDADRCQRRPRPCLADLAEQPM